MTGFLRDGRLLLSGDEQLPPVSTEESFAGFCAACGAKMKSLGFYKKNDENLIAAECDGCRALFIQRYDRGWKWQGEEALTESKDTDFGSIPEEQLESVFTGAEIEAMRAKSRGGSHSKQSLYRARKKYGKFEKLFGVKLGI